MDNQQMQQPQALHQLNFDEARVLHQAAYESGVKDQLRQLRLVLSAGKWTPEFSEWALAEVAHMASILSPGIFGGNNE